MKRCRFDDICMVTRPVTITMKKQSFKQSRPQLSLISSAPLRARQKDQMKYPPPSSSPSSPVSPTTSYATQHTNTQISNLKHRSTLTFCLLNLDSPNVFVLFVQSIPVAFYNEYLRRLSTVGRKRKVELRRRRRRRKGWKVWMVGRRVVKGWREFCDAHELKVGYVLVSRYLRNLGFDVSVFEFRNVSNGKYVCS